jgi:cell fate regulator YaaT (PSP1 superfamily)
MSGCGGCSFKGMSTEVEDTYVGVRFDEETNLTLCSTGGLPYAKGDRVIVELEGGPAHGRVERVPMPVFKPCQKSGARPLRPATHRDLAGYERKVKNEIRAKRFAREKARELGLELKISKVEFALSGRSAIFYFTAETRVDFRQLVRELSRRFSVRVKLHQLGARDEAGHLGGIGVCGRTLCCSTWLNEFQSISIAMAKRQNLSLNPSKISGQCGRLLCCLAYEDETYKNKNPERDLASQPPNAPGPLLSLGKGVYQQ